MAPTESDAVAAFAVEMAARPTRWLSEEQRSRAQQLAHALREDGATIAEIADSLRLGKTTIGRWLGSLQAPPDESAGRWLPVVVDASPSGPAFGRRGLTLYSAAGWRVEGLGLDELASLLQRGL